MPLKKFGLDTLKDLEAGKAHQAFNLHMTRAAQDCFDRPGDDKARTVIMQVDIKPVLDDDGSCSEVKAQIQVRSKVPTHRTRVYSFGLHSHGHLSFNEDDPMDISAPTMFEDED